MGGVRTYGPLQLLTNQDMSASVSTAGVDFLSLPYGSIRASWTGTPTGAFKVEGSIDNVPNAASVVNWDDTGILVIDAPSGSAGASFINLVGIGFRWLRLTYTRSSGTGALNVTIFGKGMGS